MKDRVDGRGVIEHPQPVTNILPFSVHRKRFFQPDVVDEERDEFLGKLARTVVVRAVADDDRKGVGVVPGTHEMVGGGFRCRIRTVGIVSGPFGKQSFAAKGAVHLVGGDMVEPLAMEIGGPAPPRCIEQVHGADHVGHDERCRTGNRTVNVRLRRKMDDAVETGFIKESVDKGRIGDIAFYETVVRPFLDIAEIAEITRIGKVIEIRNGIVRITIHETPHNVGTDKARSSGNQ